MFVPTKEEIMRLGALALEKVWLVLTVVIVAHVIIKIMDRLLGRLFKWTEFDRTLEKFFHKSVVTLLWLVTLGFILVLLGVDLSAIVASFGIMGFIIGFALRDTLGNFAAGVMVLVNKPFIVGDLIEVKGIQGKVKTVSMSSTKLITEDKNKVTLPNSLVWKNPIINHTAYKQVK